MTDPVCTLAGVALPVDLEWVDRDAWSPVSQRVDATLAGALLIEESRQLAGRPITLRSGQQGADWWGLITRAQLDALQALAYLPREVPMPLVLPDGYTAPVYFRHGDLAIDARPWKHVWPAEPGDFYALTLRLITAEI